MQNVGIIGALSSLGIIKIMLYMAGIIVLFKVVQALNIYIDKNSR
ncbi:hypothetical protein [Clostridium sp. HMP27]|nr:hypothetical protein [Clostridium sp. HMP27]